MEENYGCKVFNARVQELTFIKPSMMPPQRQVKGEQYHVFEQTFAHSGAGVTSSKTPAAYVQISNPCAQ